MNNQRGLAEVMLLYVVIGVFSLLFIPNPVSSSLGVGIRPNKTIQTEKVEFIKDASGTPIATKTTTCDAEIQQHVGFWEWLTSLPVFAIFLMGLGVVFPPVALILGKLWTGLKAETKKIVVSVDHALDNVNDPVVKASIKENMATVQDSSTKKLVDKIQGKT